MELGLQGEEEDLGTENVSCPEEGAGARRDAICPHPQPQAASVQPKEMLKAERVRGLL